MLNELSQRDKYLLLVGGCVAFLLLYLGLFLLPMRDGIAREERKIARLRRDFQEMVTLLRVKHSFPKETAAGRGGMSLVPFIAKTAKEAGVDDEKIGYLRPFGAEGTGAELKLEDVSGETVVRLIYNLQKASVRVTRLNMKDYEHDGNWVVKIFLEG